MNQVGGNVLIVDGDQPSRQVLSQLLSTNLPGVRVDRVAHAHAAVDQASRMQYDLFIIDLGLPDIDGLDTASALGGIKDYSGTPMIFLFKPGEMRKLEDKYPGVDYFKKPIRDQDNHFISRVERLLMLMHNLTVVKESVVCVTATKNRLEQYLGTANGNGYPQAAI